MTNCDGVQDRNTSVNLHIPSCNQHDTPKHCHSFSKHSDAIDRVAVNKLIVVIVIGVCSVIGVMFGGAMSNSLSVIADGACLSSDVICFSVNLATVYLSTRSSTKKYTYGYYRAEVLGGVLSILLMWSMTVVLSGLAIRRLYIGIDTVYMEPLTMLLTAIAGLIADVIMVLILYDKCCLCHPYEKHDKKEEIELSNIKHLEYHDVVENGVANYNQGVKKYDRVEKYDLDMNQLNHIDCDDRSMEIETETQITKDHQDNDRNTKIDDRNNLKVVEKTNKNTGRKEDKSNISILSAFYHMIGDVVQDVGTLVSSLVIYFKPSLKLVDPISTLIMSVLVFLTSWRFMFEAMTILLEGTPKNVIYDDVMDTLTSVKGVSAVHDLRIWTLNPKHRVLSVHLVIDTDIRSSHSEIQLEATKVLLQNHQLEYVTIQIDDYVPSMDQCVRCTESH